jgi:phosphonate transport system permease protein
VSASVETRAVPPPDDWPLRPGLRPWHLLLLLAALVAMSASAQRTEIDRMAVMVAEGIGAAVGLREEAEVADGLARIGRDLFPLQIAEQRPMARIENLDRDDLPWGARIETEQTVETKLDPDTLELTEERGSREVLVEPWGYLLHAVRLMLETIEIAFWGTVLAVLLAMPLAFFGARGLAPLGLYHPSRALCSLLRAMPDLLAALFLVLAFGFGPIAGVLALGLHTAGFLGKFFAEDIENADPAPQDALRAIGASRLLVLRWAVLPQVLPSYLGYVQYILERNIRTATVIGVVGAGGIGQELKGRFEMFDFGHVGTLLVVIFATVMLLEYGTGWLRRRLI